MASEDERDVQLVRHLYDGTGGHEKDWPRALALLREVIARSPDCVPALVLMGGAYFNGHGVERDLRRAFALFRRGVAGGSADAYVWLAHCYSTGAGCEPDPLRTTALLQVAARLGHMNALCSLGLFHLEGSNGLRMDSGLAARYLRKSARLGHPLAISKLSQLRAADPTGPVVPMGEWCSSYHRWVDDELHARVFCWLLVNQRLDLLPKEVEERVVLYLVSEPRFPPPEDELAILRAKVEYLTLELEKARALVHK